MQRGGEPCPYDRVLATRLGAAAARLIADEEYGYMVALKNNEITKVPLSEVAGKLKTVDPGCSMIKEAKNGRDQFRRRIRSRPYVIYGFIPEMAAGVL